MDYSENNIKFKHFDSICRFCLKSEMCLKPIYEENNEGEIVYKFEKGNESIIQMIANCTSIEICSTDFLPKFMCSRCLDKLLQCSNFRRQCLKSDEILKSITTSCRNEEIRTEQSITDVENYIKIEINVKDEGLQETNGEYPGTTPIIVNSDENDGNKLESKDKSKISERKFRGSQRPTRPVKLALCNICGKMVQDIPVHIQTHVVEKNYKCTLCPKSFSQKCRLLRHITGHSNAREYKCKVCNKAFNEKAYLAIHAVCHTGERKFVCNICNETYKFAQSLLRHKRTHFQDRRHECSTCHRTFYTKPSLTKHIRTHTGEKPYKCEHCGKGFTTSHQLATHRRTHSKDGSFKCSFCENNFVHKAGLTRHLKIHRTETETIF